MVMKSYWLWIIIFWLLLLNIYDIFLSLYHRFGQTANKKLRILASIFIMYMIPMLKCFTTKYDIYYSCLLYTLSSYEFTILSYAFSASIEIIIFFLFNLLMSWAHPCIPMTNHTIVNLIYHFLIYSWIHFAFLFIQFLSKISRQLSILCYLFLSWCQDYTSPIKWFRKIKTSFSF